MDARRLIVVYALLTAASFLVVALPGDPSGEAPWPMIAVNALLVLLLFLRGSSVAWTLLLAFGVLMVITVPLLIAVPLEVGFVALWLLEAGMVAILCTRSVRRFVHGTAYGAVTR